MFVYRWGIVDELPEVILPATDGCKRKTGGANAHQQTKSPKKQEKSGWIALCIYRLCGNIIVLGNWNNSVNLFGYQAAGKKG